MENLHEVNADKLNVYFSQKELSPSTKSKYINYFIKIENILTGYDEDKYDIFKNIQLVLKLLSEYVADKKLKVEMVKQFLQIVNKLKPSKSVENAIAIYTKKTNDYYKNKSKEELSATSLTYKDLKSLLTNKKVSDNDYLLFYILFMYGVRNKDLIISLQNTEGNYMIVNNKSIRYMRNDYKTYDKYGTLTISIKNPRFINIIKKYQEDGKQHLFENNKKMPYNHDDMTNYINSRYNHYLNTEERISEGLIYKIINNYYSQKKDTKKQVSIARSRGHDLATQEKFYE